MIRTERYGALAARLALASIFVVAGFGKLAAPEATGAYLATKGLPVPVVLAVFAGVVEFVGGLLLITGYRTRLAGLTLAAFLIPTTLLFHTSLGLPGLEAQMQQMQLLKNLAIGGGLLALATYGAGALSFDARFPRARSDESFAPIADPVVA